MPQILPEGESFKFEAPGPIGCLLLHGFTGSPQEMLELGRFLHANGITVLCRRLPGHGTNWRDMNPTRWRDWWAEAESGLAELRALRKTVFAAGLSMGGLQTLHLATHHKDLAGIVVMAAPVLVTDWRARWLLPLFRPAFMTRLVPAFPAGLSEMLDAERAKVRIHYNQAPIRCLHQILDYMKHVEPDLNQIQTPALFIHAKIDNVVPPINSQYILERIASAEKSLEWIENSRHVLTEDLDKQTVFQHTLDFIKSHC